MKASAPNRRGFPVWSTSSRYFTRQLNSVNRTHLVTKQCGDLLIEQRGQQHPLKPFLDAVKTASDFGLYDIERLERMVLRNIASEYFIAPLDKRTKPNGEPHEG